MSNTSFIKRRLEIRLTLGEGEFIEGSNTKVINELAIKANIEKLGPPDFSKADVEIVGMKLEDMEQLSTLAFKPLYHRRNYINIFAGDDISGMSQVFAGSIVEAGADFNSQPDVKFKIKAEVGFWGRVMAQGPNVIAGTQPAAKFIEGQAKKAGLTFINEGVNTSLSNCVFNGSPIEQARQAANQIGAELIIDDDEVVLIEKDKERQGDTILLKADSGLLGYPTITQNGIECKAIFNPAFRFAGLFNLETVVPKASGTWRIVKLTHKLTANDPKDGSWESSLTGFYPHLSGATGKYV